MLELFLHTQQFPNLIFFIHEEVSHGTISVYRPTCQSVVLLNWLLLDVSEHHKCFWPLIYFPAYTYIRLWLFDSFYKVTFTAL